MSILKATVGVVVDFVAVVVDIVVVVNVVALFVVTDHITLYSAQVNKDKC